MAFHYRYIEAMEYKTAQIKQFLHNQNRNQIFEMHEWTVAFGSSELIASLN